MKTPAPFGSTSECCKVPRKTRCHFEHLASGQSPTVRSSTSQQMRGWAISKASFAFDVDHCRAVVERPYVTNIDLAVRECVLTTKLPESTVTSRNTREHIARTRRPRVTPQKDDHRSSDNISAESCRGSIPLSSTKFDLVGGSRAPLFRSRPLRIETTGDRVQVLVAQVSRTHPASPTPFGGRAIAATTIPDEPEAVSSRSRYGVSRFDRQSGLRPLDMLAVERKGAA